MTATTLALENNQHHYVCDYKTTKEAWGKLADDEMVTVILRQLDCQSRIPKRVH
jgi:hypothetical protein